MTKEMPCPECGATMILRHSIKYKRLFWACSKWPDCNGIHGAHPDGNPLGTPADSITRSRRVELHQLLATVWNYRCKPQRREMYTWLKANSRSGHVSKMDATEIDEVEDAFHECFH